MLEIPIHSIILKDTPTYQDDHIALLVQNQQQLKCSIEEWLNRLWQNVATENVEG